MSLQRSTTTAAASALSMFRFAAGSSSTAGRQCQRCFRPFSSSHISRHSPRRQLQTEAFRPHSLESSLPPPTKSAIQNPSIAHSVSGLDQPWTQHSELPSREQSAATPVENDPPKPFSRVANTASSFAASPQPPATKPRKSKLRPRKAAMTLSSKAVDQLRLLLDQPNPQLIRVGVKNRGCSGLAYHLEFVDKPGAFDETVEQDGVKVLIDSKALFSIIGSEMDWVEDKLNQKFVFRNPNITEQCGCGESFSIS
ncbi:hypothetical protein AAFC00_002127 [Neodothiora populina]|uniref:Core domain-containing protein n=1 Tax=Neodothiora populina TaxID=2781224 RepID=A0ABR3PGS0_9PEZI